MKRIAGVTCALDGFHLEKCLAKPASRLRKERKEEALEELRETIRKKTKKEFKEQELLSSAQIIQTEKNRHGDMGKYLESIRHSVSEQVKKMVYFNEHIWGL